jgi:hypothetical protein
MSWEEFQDHIEKSHPELNSLIKLRQQEQRVLALGIIGIRDDYSDQRAGGFDWSATPEGRSFWRCIFHDREFIHFYLTKGKESPVTSTLVSEVPDNETGKPLILRSNKRLLSQISVIQTVK